MHKFSLRTGLGVFRVLMSSEGQLPTSPLYLVRKLVADEADRLMAGTSLTSLPIEDVCTSLASRGDAMTEQFEMRLAPDMNSVLFDKVEKTSDRGVWATWSDVEAALNGKDHSVDILDRLPQSVFHSKFDTSRIEEFGEVRRQRIARDVAYNQIEARIAAKALKRA